MRGWDWSLAIRRGFVHAVNLRPLAFKLVIKYDNSVSLRTQVPLLIPFIDVPLEAGIRIVLLAGCYLFRNAV